MGQIQPTCPKSRRYSEKFKKTVFRGSELNSWSVSEIGVAGKLKFVKKIYVNYKKIAVSELFLIDFSY